MRLLLLATIVIFCACSSRPDSTSIAGWTKLLKRGQSALLETDTSPIRELLHSADVQLDVFRSGAFHDTLSLPEGQLIDSVLSEKKLLQWLLSDRDTTLHHLDLQLQELKKLKDVIKHQEGTVSERRKLLFNAEKDVRKLTAHTHELVAAISKNTWALSRQLRQLNLMNINN